MLAFVITPPIPPEQVIAPPHRSPVSAWRRVRRYSIRGIACCAVWPVSLAVAGLVSAGAQAAPATAAITVGVAAASVVSFAALLAAKTALWWYGEG